MTVINTIVETVGIAVSGVSNLAQDIIDKSRTKAKLNRLRTLIKSECELMNRAYIALGKDYYEQLKKGAEPQSEKEEKLLELIDNCKAKIAKARDCYRQIIESRNDFLYSAAASASENGESFEKQDVVDITVACSNENEYASSPFEEQTVPPEEPEEPEKPEDEESPDGELF